MLKQVHFLNMEIKLMYIHIYAENKSKKRIKEWALWVC